VERKRKQRALDAQVKRNYEEWHKKTAEPRRKAMVKELYFYTPLIAHALGAGSHFPSFPTNDPNIAIWIPAVASILLEFGDPRTWQSDPSPPHYGALQRHVQWKLENTGQVDILYAMNSYAHDIPHTACEGPHSLPHLDVDHTQVALTGTEAQVSAKSRISVLTQIVERS
jgi:hypothetical protein